MMLLPLIRIRRIFLDIREELFSLFVYLKTMMVKMVVKKKYTHHQLVNATGIGSDLVPERSFLVEFVLELPASRATASGHVARK
jgi:hypothetical protein